MLLEAVACWKKARPRRQTKRRNRILELGNGHGLFKVFLLFRVSWTFKFLRFEMWLFAGGNVW